MKAKSKPRHRKPVHETGDPSPHGFEVTHLTLPGGRIFWDASHDEWVAVRLTAVLGRFKERADAEHAVEQSATEGRGQRLVDLDHPDEQDEEG